MTFVIGILCGMVLMLVILFIGLPRRDCVNTRPLSGVRSGPTVKATGVVGDKVVEVKP